MSSLASESIERQVELLEIRENSQLNWGLWGKLYHLMEFLIIVYYLRILFQYYDILMIHG